MLNIISSSRYKINRRLLKKVAGEVLTGYNMPDNAIFNIVFIGKKKMKDIASKYKKENVALPVLSFSYNPGQLRKETKQLNELESEQVANGEVFICYPQAVLLAAEREKKVDDMMTYLIQHGLENILK